MCLAVLWGTTTSMAQDNASEKNPMVVLKIMSDTLASKSRLSLTTTSIYDEKFEDQLIKGIVAHRVDVVRPNTLYVEAVFDDGEKWVGAFDGKVLRYYELAEQEYSEIPFEGTVGELVDKLDASGLSQTPLNDFLREDFFAAIEPDIFDATLIGGYIDPIDGKSDINHLLFQSPGAVWQLWVGRGSNDLPKRLVVTYTDIGRPEYAVTFDSWKFNSKPEELAAEYNIPTNLDGWTKVDFVNPINFK